MAVAPESCEAVLAPAVSETAERLFREHSGWIYGYCLRLLRSREEAEDALQATYLNACRSLSQGVRPIADSAWLLRITQNACYTRLRSSGRRAGIEQVRDLTLLEETVPAPDRPRDELIGLTDALLSLPEQQRRAILLREWQGLSHREVAQTLGLTQGAAETLIFRARRSLAAALENEPKRARLRALHALDLGALLATIKGFFAGAAGAKAAAAVMVAAATTATVVASDPAGIRGDQPEPVTAQTAVRAPTPASASPTAAELPVGVHADGAVGGSGEAAARRASEPGRARKDGAPPAAEEKAGNGNGNGRGQATAAAAKAKPKSENGNGRALGRTGSTNAVSKSSNGRGTHAGGRPDSAGQTGPPPQAKANAHAKGKAAKTSASD
ncbi:MAG: sigma-70 family RNA polymerase sigma factor [Gaiellaceae bacterium]